MTEIALQPPASVEVWDSFVHNGTLYYGLLNRNANYRAEVHRRRANGAIEQLWLGDVRFKYASVSISALGTSLIVTYSRANGRDSKTPYRPYMVTIANVVN
jgi:hypothetical protein